MFGPALPVNPVRPIATADPCTLNSVEQIDVSISARERSTARVPLHSAVPRALRPMKTTCAFAKRAVPKRSSHVQGPVRQAIRNAREQGKFAWAKPAPKGDAAPPTICRAYSVSAWKAANRTTNVPRRDPSVAAPPASAWPVAKWENAEQPKYVTWTASAALRALRTKTARR